MYTFFPSFAWTQTWRWTILFTVQIQSSFFLYHPRPSPHSHHYHNHHSHTHPHTHTHTLHHHQCHHPVPPLKTLRKDRVFSKIDACDLHMVALVRNGWLEGSFNSEGAQEEKGTRKDGREGMRKERERERERGEEGKVGWVLGRRIIPSLRPSLPLPLPLSPSLQVPLRYEKLALLLIPSENTCDRGEGKMRLMYSKDCLHMVNPWEGRLRSI